MSYKAVTEWLFNQIPNYQLQGSNAYKPGLDKIKALLERIGNPQDKSKFIHISGTNGKGSVAHILSSIFSENEYKTGLFTSPHILDFRERIKIDGKVISEEFVVDFIEKYKDVFLELEVSFFEITAAMAFKAFESESCDIGIIETGLGGRLDATNVIHPEISIITNIGLEHTQFLGDTLEKIAFEKGGIIKENVPVVIGEKSPLTSPVFESIAQEKNVELYYTVFRNGFETDLGGSFQQDNISIALKAVEVLKTKGWNLDIDKVTEALKHVYRNTGFVGRMQMISEKPKILLDVAHNADGVKTLLKEIDNMNFDCLHIVYGSSDDKDIQTIGSFLPKKATYYLTSFNSKRSLTNERLTQMGNDFGLKYSVYKKPTEALHEAKATAGKDDLILVFGSFYLLDEILSS